MADKEASAEDQGSGQAETTLADEMADNDPGPIEIDFVMKEAIPGYMLRYRMQPESADNDKPGRRTAE